MNGTISSPSFEKLRQEVRAHNALKELEKFGNNIYERGMTSDEVKCYFATMWTFFREIPNGILSLALKVSDDWMTVDEWGGTRKGAHILFADVDEFGLQTLHKKFQPTHHELFKEMVNFLDVQDTDFQNPKYVMDAGRDMGKITKDYYRKRSIGCGLGFHLASELSSSIEFKYFLDGFSRHRDHYGIKSDNDTILTFFRIHTLVEPMHLAQSEEIICYHIGRNPESLADVEQGAVAFMTGFEKLFSELNYAIFGN